MLEDYDIDPGPNAEYFKRSHSTHMALGGYTSSGPNEPPLSIEPQRNRSPEAHLSSKVDVRLHCKWRVCEIHGGFDQRFPGWQKSRKEAKEDQLMVGNAPSKIVMVCARDIRSLLIEPLQQSLGLGEAQCRRVDTHFIAPA
jgi:hypothetical protein